MKQKCIVIVVILILFNIMSTLNPLDNTLATKLNSLEERLNNLERTRQPYQGDWITITSPVSRGTTTVIYAGDYLFDMSKIFQVGDKVKATMSAVDYFGYVVLVDPTYIEIRGNDLPVGTIDNFYYSRVSSPSGFPYLFEFTPTLAGSGSMTVTAGDNYGYYYLIGNIMHVQYNIYPITLGGTASYHIRVGIPYPANNPTLNLGFQIVVGGDGGVTNFGEVFFGGASYDYCLVLKPDGGDYTLGANSSRVQGIISYPI